MWGGCVFIRNQEGYDCIIHIRYKDDDFHDTGWYPYKNAVNPLIAVLLSLFLVFHSTIIKSSSSCYLDRIWTVCSCVISLLLKFSAEYGPSKRSIKFETIFSQMVIWRIFLFCSLRTDSADCAYGAKICSKRHSNQEIFTATATCKRWKRYSAATDTQTKMIASTTVL